VYERIGDEFKHIKNLAGEHNATNFESFVKVGNGSLKEFEIQLPILACIQDVFIGLSKQMIYLRKIQNNYQDVSGYINEKNNFILVKLNPKDAEQTY
jgi:hypothetical protein